MLGDILSPAYLPRLSRWSPTDQATDHELVAQNVTKHVLVSKTVWVSPLIITVELSRTLTWFCFSRNLSWLCQWHFAELNIVKKSHDKATDQALVAKMTRSTHWSHQSFWVIPLIITYLDVDMDFVSVRFFYDIDSDILQHWLCYLTTTNLVGRDVVRALVCTQITDTSLGESWFAKCKVDWVADCLFALHKGSFVLRRPRQNIPFLGTASQAMVEWFCRTRSRQPRHSKSVSRVCVCVCVCVGKWWLILAHFRLPLLFHETGTCVFFCFFLSQEDNKIATLSLECHLTR